MGDPNPPTPDSYRQPFPSSTRVWDRLSELQDRGAIEPQELGFLVELYWRPVYAFLRRKGHRRDDAMDLVQSFFLKLMDKRWAERANPSRGRFRTFLLTCLVRLVKDERELRQAEHERRILSIDTLIAGSDAAFDFPSEGTPEEAFDRTCAQDLMKRAWERFKGACLAAGKAHWIDAFDAWMADRAHGRPDMKALAAASGMDDDALRYAISTCKKLWEDAVRDEIRGTLGPDAADEDVDREIADLIGNLGTGD